MIQEICELLQRSGHFLGLFLTLFGSFFTLLYLSNVEKIAFLVLEIGVAMIVLGIILSYTVLKYDGKAEPLFLLSVYIMFFALTIMHFVRFNPLSGGDNVREFRAAEITLTYGWNTPNAIQSARVVEPSLETFFSCLSVTMLPSILSSVIGVELVDISKFGLSAIVCLRPVLVYLNVKEVFGKRELAALSAILYSQLYFIFYTFNTRDSIATVFLLCTLLIFFKLMKTPRARVAFLPPLFMFIFGVVASHYTIAYSSNAVLFVFLLTLYVASKLPTKILNLFKIDLRKPYFIVSLTGYVLIFSTILSVAWLSLLSGSSPFFRHLDSWIIYRHPPSVPVPEYGPQSRFLAASPLGPLIDNWFKLVVIFAFTGFWLLAFRVKKNSRALLWLSTGGLFFIGFLSTFIPYVYQSFGEFTRVYRMGFPFFSVFIALILLKLNKKSKGMLLILFLLLNLPMNMLLPIHSKYVLYHTKELVSPNRAVGQPYIDQAEFELSRWARNHVPTDEILSVDNRGYVFLYYTNNKLFMFVDTVTFHSRYLVLHYFSIKYGLWQSRESIEVRRSDQVPSLINFNNVIYNNGQDMMLHQNTTINP